MTKFKIQVETKQLWEVEIEAENFEKAKGTRDKIYDVTQQFIIDSEISIQETMQMTSTLSGTEILELAETFGGDDLTDDDIKDLEVEELPEADRFGG